jgi:hypothetical protein
LFISEEEIEENRSSSWWKEINATQGPDREPILDYSLWFPPYSDVSISLSPHTPTAVDHNTRIRHLFSEWRRDITGSVLYPQLQDSKSVSRETALNYQYAVSGNGDILESSDVTSAMIERFYSETGSQVQGPCELRQAWKYNDLTPRTYFAQGGTVFHASKYIRHIVNSLANTFPEVNFISRFSINELNLNNLMTAAIYDYSSFTSNLTELKYFLEKLAIFCSGVEVIIVDSHHGPKTIDLGDLIREYNDVCNRFAEFSLIRLGLPEVLKHQKAGLLGVYGNITSSTVLHGLHACQLCGDESSCRCVGDDVMLTFLSMTQAERERLIGTVQSLGEINKEKFRFWTYRPVEEEEDNNDRTWVYTKRPLDRLENKLTLYPSLYLPIFGLISGIKDSVHEEVLDISHIKILVTQTSSAIRQLKAIFPSPPEVEVEILRRYLQRLYSLAGLPHSGLLPFETKRTIVGYVSGLLVPCVDGDILAMDQWILLQERWENRESPSITVPRYTREDVELSQLFVHGYGEGTMTRKIAYMRNMQWAEAEIIFEERIFEYQEYCSLVDDVLLGEVFPMYYVRLLPGTPSWLRDL